jgi:hypothetical protein
MIRAFALQCAGIAAILAVLYWWTGLPESTGIQLAASALVLTACLAGLGFLAIIGVRALRPAEPVGLPGWIAAVVFFVIALRFAYWIIWWVPAAAGFGAQVASMAVRFSLAYLFAVAGWTALLRAIASGIPRSTHPSTAPRP